MLQWVGKHLVGFLFVLLLIAIGVIAYLIFLVSGSPDKEEVVVDDPKKPAEIVEFTEALERFRAEWNIYGRFEEWPTVLPLAHMSEISYDTGDQPAEGRFKALGFEDVVCISSPLHSQVAYVVSGEDVAVVVFRGTDDTEDWIQNINKYVHQGDDGGMHSGFAGCYSALRQEIIKVVKELKSKHVWITGHSLGGAQALLCAYDFEKYHDIQVKGVFTYGQPMIARQKFAAYLQNTLGTRYVHFVNESDAVPRLPDDSFDHCGLLIWFDNGKIKKSRKYKRLLAMSGVDNAAIETGEVLFVDDLPKYTRPEFESLQKQLNDLESDLFPIDKFVPGELRDKTEIPEQWQLPFGQLPEGAQTTPFRVGGSRQGGDDRNPHRERILDPFKDMRIDDQQYREEFPFEFRRFQSVDAKPIPTGFRIPWKDDHNMSEYIVKIEQAIQDAKEEGN